MAAILLLAMLAAFALASPDGLGPKTIASSCWVSASRSQDVVALARSAQRWPCAHRNHSIAAERVLLRFDIDPNQPPPRYFLSRRSALEAMHLIAIDRDGAVRRSTLPAAALASSIAGGRFKAPLPEVTRETRHIVAAVDLPSHRMTLEQARLAPTDSASGDGSMRFLLILAGLAGMLAMPLIFNAAFYRVLREPFVIWHSAFTLSQVFTIVVTSGLAVVFFDPPAMALSWITTVLFGATIASVAMFTHSFIEPGLMHPWLRRLLPYCAAWAMALSALHAAFPFVARPLQSGAYTAAFAPVLVIFVLAMVDALRRGSRAAKFQAIGYAPMVAVGLIRLVTGVNPMTPSNDAMTLFYIGCVSEVLLTTLGMADRFVTIKRERDRARGEADVLERLSETDPLTGLLNRRSIERQFRRLRSQGFSALAVIDLDNFKAINDVNGHAIGDAVLKAVAQALQPSANVRAYRLGGEEFVLLLRGEDAMVQAEFRRQAIAAVVANEISGLERLVTASMGVADIQGDEDFAKPYDRADKLLYEAKSAGRNRTRSAITPAAPRNAHTHDHAMIA